MRGDLIEKDSLINQTRDELEARDRFIDNLQSQLSGTLQLFPTEPDIGERINSPLH